MELKYFLSDINDLRIHESNNDLSEWGKNKLKEYEFILAELTELKKSQLPDFIGTWIAVSDRLPEISKDAPSYATYVKVIACWGNRIENVAQMDYCRRIVRGKEVYRFEWMGRISPWKVDYWMEFPNPPNHL